MAATILRKRCSLTSSKRPIAMQWRRFYTRQGLSEVRTQLLGDARAPLLTCLAVPSSADSRASGHKRIRSIFSLYPKHLICTGVTTTGGGHASLSVPAADSLFENLVDSQVGPS